MPVLNLSITLIDGAVRSKAFRSFDQRGARPIARAATAHPGVYLHLDSRVCDNERGAGCGGPPSRSVAPILAARNVETSDGHVLLLWVYLDHDKVEFELDKGDDEADEDNLE